jgi:hypothetical protein
MYYTRAGGSLIVTPKNDRPRPPDFDMLGREFRKDSENNSADLWPQMEFPARIECDKVRWVSDWHIPWTQALEIT